MNAEEKEFEEWKIKIKNEIYQEADDLITNDPAYYQLYLWANKIKRKLDKINKQLKDKPNNKELKKDYEYYDDLASALFVEMYKKSPVEALAELQEMVSSKRKYSKEDLGVFVCNYNRQKIFEEEREAILVEKIPLTIEEPKTPELEQKIEELDKKYDFCKECAERCGKEVPDSIRNMINRVQAGVDMDKLAQEHTEYVAKLASQTRKIQDKQIELLAAHENGDETVTVAKLNKHQDLFNKWFYQREDAKFIAGMIPDLYKRLDLEKQEEDDVILKASGEEVFGKMNRRQRYEAKVSLKEYQKGKRPNWISRLVLRLPSKRTDELIKEYIDEGKMDVKYVMGYSREDLAVREEGRKLAEKQREEASSEGEEKDEDKKEPEDTIIKTDTEKKEKPKDGKNEKADDESGEKKVNEDQTIERIMELFEKLSPEARIEVIAEHFGLDENQKNILSLFDKLSPEAKAEYLANDGKSDKDRSKE